MKRSRHHNIDFPYVFQMLGCAILIALMLAMCGICSRIVPL